MSDTIQAQSCAYTSDADLYLIQDFLIAFIGARPPHTYWHLGNLMWSTYFGTHYDPCRDVRIWEDQDGGVLGFAWFEEPSSVEIMVDPRFRGSGLLETPMLAWAAEHAQGFEQPGERKLWTSTLGDDTEYARVLLEHGFERGDASMVQMLRELNDPLPPTPLPDGWTVRHVGGEDEWEERVDVHREVWHPSRITLEAYRRLRSAPCYNPELDLVVVAPDGIFASYCICWIDQVNMIGLFEPAGTRPAYRRKGLGTAVMMEGLRRLQASGASSAWVSTGAQSDHAIKLYESVGFHIGNREYRYSKRL